MNLIRVQLHSEKSTTPEFVFPMAMGYEIFSAEAKIIEAGKTDLVDTGLSIIVPQGSYAQIISRPSLASIGVNAGAPLFRPGSNIYLKIVLSNQGSNHLAIFEGDKIATLVVLPTDPPLIVQSPDEDAPPPYNEVCQK